MSQPNDTSNKGVKPTKKLDKQDKTISEHNAPYKLLEMLIRIIGGVISTYLALVVILNIIIIATPLFQDTEQTLVFKINWQ